MAVTAQQLYEQTLVLRSQIGDEAAFAELLALHGPRVLLFIQRLLQNMPDQVADVSQEVWLAIYRGLPKLQDAARFTPWALRIARDRVYREYRRRKLPTEPFDETMREVYLESNPGETTIAPETLQSSLDRLSPEHREAVVLRYFEDLSYEEIALKMGTSVGTVRSRIHYGKRALRTDLEGKST
ncbi:MAG TPA: sigma-70 family RNA polymerase sigma factor [Candidatus Limnocylindria bacterium]|jgi:RNA polymerase sigma-70 factor (ECF subfamily)|nr:sigma-70 family RNA polymerase sigma factor [Candidatus Limnocylindria bacterium]